MASESATNESPQPQPSPVAGATASSASPASYDFGDRLTALLMKYRWAFVVPVVLPLSKLFDAAVLYQGLGG